MLLTEEQVIHWLTKEPPDPECWFSICDHDADELCPALDWFYGRMVVEPTIDENGVVIAMEWFLSNGGSYAVYRGASSFLNVRLEIKRDDDDAICTYALGGLQFVSVSCPEGYGKRLWEAGEEYFEMVEAETISQREGEREAQERRETQGKKEQLKQRRADAVASQTALF